MCWPASPSATWAARASSGCWCATSAARNCWQPWQPGGLNGTNRPGIESGDADSFSLLPGLFPHEELPPGRPQYWFPDAAIGGRVAAGKAFLLTYFPQPSVYDTNHEHSDLTVCSDGSK